MSPSPHPRSVHLELDRREKKSAHSSPFAINGLTLEPGADQHFGFVFPGFLTLPVAAFHQSPPVPCLQPLPSFFSPMLLSALCLLLAVSAKGISALYFLFPNSQF